jgi:hypothetical protein
MGRNEFDLEALSRGHPVRRFVFGNPLSRFLTRHLTIGDILSEAFYGVWMASVSTGIVFGATDPTSTSALFTMVIIALSVNIVWGTIDGWTSVFGPKVNDANNDRALRRLWSDPNDQKAKEWVQEEISAGMGRNLDEVRAQRVCDIYIEKEPQVPVGYQHRMDRDDAMVIVSLVTIEALMALLIVFPYLIFPGETYGPIISRTIAISISGAIAYWFARRLNRPHPWVWVLFFVVLIFAVVTFSWVTGW